MPPPEQSWPVTAELVLGVVSSSRLEEIACFFRLPLPPGPSWEKVRARVLLEPAVNAVALLHLLTRRELAVVCRMVSVHDHGPTQDVLSRLLPLCAPSPGVQP